MPPPVTAVATCDFTAGGYRGGKLLPFTATLVVHNGTDGPSQDEISALKTRAFFETAKTAKSQIFLSYPLFSVDPSSYGQIFFQRVRYTQYCK
ncbi:unnamed protein product [Caenorhabditis brenneri]